MAPLTLPDLQDWLLSRALPLWLDRGIDHGGGGFHEHLCHDTYICDAPFRRLRVLARQIVAFSQAARYGVPHAAEAVRMGIDTLARHAALPGGGYAWRFDLAHVPIDTTRDLYDHAFVLLALTEATAVLPPDTLCGQARAVLAFLDAQLTHPAGGYHEALPPSLPRRQNPHMHLLEALLAAHGAFGDPIFIERAHALVRLFADRMLDHQTGALPEFFDENWRPVPQDGPFQTEPGHHCEWAWLLHSYARHAGEDPHHAVIASRLLAFADAHGRHPVTGDLIDSVGGDGAPLEQSARLWAQAERLRTAFLRPDRSEAGQREALTSLSAYLRPDGTWHERRNADGRFIAGPSPASSLYHLTGTILTASTPAD